MARISWPGVFQAVAVALLLAILGAVFETYQHAQRIPELEAKVEKLTKKVESLRLATAVLNIRSQGRETVRLEIPEDE